MDIHLCHRPIWDAVHLVASQSQGAQLEDGGRNSRSSCTRVPFGQTHRLSQKRSRHAHTMLCHTYYCSNRDLPIELRGKFRHSTADIHLERCCRTPAGGLQMCSQLMHKKHISVGQYLVASIWHHQSIGGRLHNCPHPLDTCLAPGRFLLPHFDENRPKTCPQSWH